MSRRTVIRAVGGGVGLGAVILLGLMLPSGRRPMGWEADVVRVLRLHHAPGWIRVASYLKELGGEPAVTVTTLAIVLLLLVTGHRRTALVAFAAILFGSAGSEVAKHIVGRHISPAHALGYPSGSTASATVVLVTLAVVVTRLANARRWLCILSWVAAAVVGAAVGWSVVATGAHYPGDALGGLAFGVFTVVTITPMLRPRPS